MCDHGAALPLLLVSGPPACGKSTLAPRLAPALKLPLLARDSIGAALAGTLHSYGDEQRPVVLRATFRVFYRLMADMLRVGDGLVAESNFHRGAAEGDLRPFLATARIVIVHCHAPREVSYARFIARSTQADRQWSSFDAQRVAQISAGQIPEAWERAQPLDLGVPSLTVGTTAGYRPDLDRIVAFIQSAALNDDAGEPGERRPMCAP